MIEKVPNSDALVALAGVRFTPDGTMGVDSEQRIQTAVDLFHDGVAPNIVVSGAYPSTILNRPASTLAEQMRAYALDHDVPDAAVHMENVSVDTIGNAVFTKTTIVVPNDWEKLTIVSSSSHLDRAMRTFTRVMGPNYELDGVSSGETLYKKQLFNEVLGEVALFAVTHGIEDGDDAAILERLVGIVPGYEDISAVRRVGNILKGSLGVIKR